MRDSPHNHCILPLSNGGVCVRFALSICLAMLSTTSGIQAQSKPAAPAIDQRDADWGKPIDLLAGELNVRWKHFSCVDQTPLPTVWKRIGNSDTTKTELVCFGAPRGYLFSNQKYDEFDFSFEWRYVSDPNGNSGVLVFTQDDRRLWPTSIQVQLHQPEAGSVFPSGDAVVQDATVKKEGLAKAVGEWNKCHIVSRDARILVHINGEKSGEVTGCKPASGRIAIQSEGSEVHFRRIMIRTPVVTHEQTTGGSSADADDPRKIEPDDDADS